MIDHKEFSEKYNPVIKDIVQEYRTTVNATPPDDDGTAGSPEGRYFTSTDEYRDYTDKLLKPAKEYWDNPEMGLEELYKAKNEQEGNDEDPFETFLKDYENRDKEVYDEETMRVDMVALNSDYGYQFVDKTWFTEFDPDPRISRTQRTIGGALQFGDFWTNPIRSAREAQLEGKTYINDQGELVELGPDEDWADNAVGDTTDVIRSDNKEHQSVDGRMITGFEYNYEHMNPYDRVKPALRAIYEGDMPWGEVVSKWDMSDNWLLKSNQLDRNGFMDIPVAAVRSLLNTSVDLASGLIDMGRSIASMAGADESDPLMQSTRDLITGLTGYKVSKTDEDMASAVTWSNALDLIGSVYMQLAIVGRIGGMAKAIATASKLPTASAQMFVKSMNWIGYGSIAASGMRDEAIQHGFSEKSSSALALAFMAAIGAIGSSSSLLLPNWEERLFRETVKKLVRTRLALSPIKEFGANKATFQMAKNIADDVVDAGKVMVGKVGAKSRWYDSSVRRMAFPKAGTKWLSQARRADMGAGTEEMVEEIAEVFMERGLKGMWNFAGEMGLVDLEITDPRMKKGFMTIYDPEYWSSLPMELIMSAVGGFGGGVMARRMFNLSSNLNHLLPFKDEDLDKLGRIALASNQKKHEGKVAEGEFLKMIKKMYEEGGLGSHEITIDRDPETGRLLKKTDNPKGHSVADANYNLMLYQYNLLKTQTSGWSGSYDEFMAAHPDIEDAVKYGGYQAERFNANFKELNSLLGVDDGVEAALADVTGETSVAKSESSRPWWKFWAKRKAQAAAEETAAEVEETQEPEPEPEGEGIPAEGEGEGEEEVTEVTDQPSEQQEAAAVEFIREEKEALELEAEAISALHPSMGMEDARKVAQLTKENQDMLDGLTAERDYVISVIRKTPEFSVLDDEQWGAFKEKFSEELLKADHRKYKQEAEDSAEVEKRTVEVEALIKSATTPTELMAVSALAGANGKIRMTPDQHMRLKAKFNETLDSVATPEEIKQYKTELTKKLGLFDQEGGEAGPEITMGAYKVGEMISPDRIVKNSKSSGLLTRLEKGNLQPPVQITALKDVNQDNNTVRVDISVIDPAQAGGVSFFEVDLNGKTNKAENTSVDRMPMSQATAELQARFMTEVFVPNVSETEENKVIAINKWIEENANFLTKYAQTMLIQSATTVTDFTDVTHDPTGASIINFIKTKMSDPNSTYANLEQAIQNSVFAAASEEFYPEGVVPQPIFYAGTSLHAKVTPFLDAWADIEIEEFIAKRPNEDIIEMLLRAFDATGRFEVQTDAKSLFNTQWFDVYGKELGKVQRPGEIIKDAEGNVIWDGTLMEKGFLENLRDDIIELPNGDQIFNNVEKAIAIKQQLLARQALIKLWVNDFTIQNHLDQRVPIPFLENLATLRVYNSKVYSKQEYHAPVDMAQYDIYSKFFAFHIFDPVRYFYIEEKEARGVPLSAEEQKEKAEMILRSNVMQYSLLPNIEKALEELDELIDLGVESMDEANLLRIYKEGVETYGKGVLKSIGAFTQSSGGRGYKEVLTREQLVTLDGFAIKIQSLLDGDVTDDTRVAIVQTISELADYMYNLPREIKEEIVQFGDPAAASTYKGTLFSFMTSNHRDYYSRVKDVPGIIHKPIMAQDRAAYSTFFGLDQFESDENPSATKRLGVFKHLVFLDSDQSTGKTVVIAPLAIYAYQQKLKEIAGQEGSIEDEKKIGVLVGAHSKKRANAFRGILSKAGIGLVSPNGVAEGLDTKGMYDFIVGGTLDEATDRLDNISVIAFDEVTHIWAQMDGGKADLNKMLERINEINARRAHEGRRPIKFLGVGDSKQGGWKEGMPTVETWGTTPEYKEYAEPENVAKWQGQLFQTLRMDNSYRFRAAISEITDASREFSTLAARIRTSAIDREKLNIEGIETRYGPVKDHSDGRLGGVQFVHSASDFYSNDKSKWTADHIRHQIEEAKKRGEEFTVVIVDDASKGKVSNLREGHLKKLAEDYPDNVEIETIYTVQGGEYDYVLAIPPPGFIPKLGELTGGHATNLDLMAMIIGRARYFAQVVIREDAGIAAKQSEMYEVPKLRRDQLEKDWEGFRSKLLEHIEAVEVSPEIVIPDVVDEYNIETPDEADTEPSDLEDEAHVTYDIAVTKAKDDILKKHGKESKDDIITEIKKYSKVRDDKGRGDTERKEAEQIVSDLNTVVFDVETVEDIDPYTKEKAKMVQNITGVKSKHQKILQELGKASHQHTAQVLDAAGYGLGYTHIKQEYTRTKTGKLAVTEALEKRVAYANDLVGEENVMSANQQLRHIERASGFSPDGEKAQKDYKYFVYTYEYGYRKDRVSEPVAHATDLYKATIIVAEYIGVDEEDNRKKQFILMQFPSDTDNKVTKGNLKAYLTTRNQELNAAVGQLETAIGDGTTLKAGDFSYDQYNANQITHEAGLLPGTENAIMGDAYRKKVTATRVDGKPIDGPRSYGTVFIKTEVTDAIQQGKIFAGTTMGELVTGSEDTRRRLGDIEGSPNKYKDFDVLNEKADHLTKDFQLRVDTIASFKELNSDNIDLFKTSFLYGPQDNIMSYVDGDQTFYVMVFRGQDGKPVPMAYRVPQTGEKGTWLAIWGINKDGQFIMDPNAKLTKGGQYYSESVKALTNGIKKLKVSPTALTDGEAYNRNDDKDVNNLSKKFAKALTYDKMIIDGESTKTGQFEHASHWALKPDIRNFHQEKITIGKLKQMLEVAYKETGSPGHVQVSQPLVFTEAPEAIKGRTFVIYATGGNYNLNDVTDLRRAMGHIDLMSIPFDPKDPLAYFTNRQGVGVIMLDSKPTGLKSAFQNYTQNGEVIDSIELDRSLLSTSSASNKRMISMFGQLGNLFAFGLEGNGVGSEISELFLADTGAHKRLLALNQAIVDEKRGLKPVFDNDKLKMVHDEVMKRLASGDEDQEASAKAFLMLLSYTLEDVNLGHIVTAGKNQVDGKVKGLHVVRNKDTKIPRTDRPHTGAMLFIPDTVFTTEDKHMPENLNGFSLAYLFKAMLGHDKRFPNLSNQSLIDKSGYDVAILTLDLVDKIMMEMTNDRTLGHGVFVTPKAVLTEKAEIGWAKLEDGAEDMLYTNVKNIYNKSLIVDLAALAEATISPSKPTDTHAMLDLRFTHERKAVEKHWEERIDKLDENDVKYVPTIDGYKKEMKLDVDEFINRWKTEGYRADHELDATGTFMKKSLDNYADAAKKKAKIGIEYKLADLDAEGINLFGGYEVMKADIGEDLALEIWGAIDFIRRAVEPETVNKYILKIEDALAKIPINNDKGALQLRYNMLMGPTLEYLKTIPTTELDEIERIKRLIQMYDEAPFFNQSDKMDAEAHIVVSHVSSYTFDPFEKGNRDAIVKARILLRNDPAAVEILETVLSPNPEAYLLARQLLPMAKTVDLNTNETARNFKISFPVEYDKFINSIAWKDAVGILMDDSSYPKSTEDFRNKMRAILNNNQPIGTKIVRLKGLHKLAYATQKVHTGMSNVDNDIVRKEIEEQIKLLEALNANPLPTPITIQYLKDWRAALAGELTALEKQQMGDEISEKRDALIELKAFTEGMGDMKIERALQVMNRMLYDMNPAADLIDLQNTDPEAFNNHPRMVEYKDALDLYEYVQTEFDLESQQRIDALIEEYNNMEADLQTGLPTENLTLSRATMVNKQFMNAIRKTFPKVRMDISVPIQDLIKERDETMAFSPAEHLKTEAISTDSMDELMEWVKTTLNEKFYPIVDAKYDGKNLILTDQNDVDFVVEALIVSQDGFLKITPHEDFDLMMVDRFASGRSSEMDSYYNKELDKLFMKMETNLNTIPTDTVVGIENKLINGPAFDSIELDTTKQMLKGIAKTLDTEFQTADKESYDALMKGLETSPDIGSIEEELYNNAMIATNLWLAGNTSYSIDKISTFFDELSNLDNNC